MALPSAFILAIVMCVFQAQARPQEAYILEDQADTKDFNEWLLDFMSDMLRTIDSYLKPIMDEFAEITPTGLNEGETSSVFVIQRMNDQGNEDSLNVDGVNVEKPPKYEKALKDEVAQANEITSKHDETPEYEETPKDEEYPHYFTIDIISPPDCDLVSPLELE